MKLTYVETKFETSLKLRHSTPSTAAIFILFCFIECFKKIKFQRQLNTESFKKIVDVAKVA